MRSVVCLALWCFTLVGFARGDCLAEQERYNQTFREMFPVCDKSCIEKKGVYFNKLFPTCGGDLTQGAISNDSSRRRLLQRYTLCSITSNGDYTKSANCSITSTIQIGSGDALKITGVLWANGEKPAIDGGWDGIKDSNTGVVSMFRLGSSSNYFSGVVVIENVILTHAETCFEMYAGSLTVSNSLVTRNFNHQGAAFKVGGGSLIVSDSIVSENFAPGQGGGFNINSPDGMMCGNGPECAPSSVKIFNSIISSNSADQGPGFDISGGPSVTISRCVISKNYGTNTGSAGGITGGLQIDASDSSRPMTLVIAETFMSGNRKYDNNLHGINFHAFETNSIFIRVNMNSFDFQDSITGNSVPTPKTCAYSTTLCADAGLPGTTCTDRSPTSLGVWCNASTSYPYISSITSPNCTNDNSDDNHLNKCPVIGATITITGLYFDQTGSTTKNVKVGGVVCPYTSWTPIEIVCNLPAGIGANLVVNVTATNGISNAQVPEKLLSFTPPTITTITPNAGTSQGVQTTFTGTNFGASSSSITIKINNVACTSVTWVSNTEVQATTPAGSGGNHAVVIIVGGQESTSAPQFSYKDPVITNVIPTLAGGQMIIQGEEFANSGTLTIVAKDRGTSSEVACDNPQRVSYAELRCTYNFQGVKGQCQEKDMIVRIDGLESNLRHLCYPGIKLENTDLLEVVAGGASKSFTIKGLSVAPLSDVNVTITSPSVLVSVDPGTFTFTTSAWQNVNKSISVTASNGNYAGGTNFVLNIQSESDDLKFSGVEVTKTVVVSTAGVTAPTLIGLPAQGFVSEGGIYQYSLKLSISPQANTVSILLSSSNSKCAALQTSVSFTTANWDTFQTIQISAEQDNAFFAKESTSYQCNINHEVDTDDTLYTNLATETFSLSVTSTGCGLGEFLGAYNRANGGTECICSQNYFLPPNSDCVTCPADQSVCSSLGLKAPPVAKNWWRYDPTSPDLQTYKFYSCPFPDTCLGGNSTVGRCLEGHDDMGVICATCSPEFVLQGQRCISCPGRKDAAVFSPELLLVCMAGLIFFSLATFAFLTQPALTKKDVQLLKAELKPSELQSGIGC